MTSTETHPSAGSMAFIQQLLIDEAGPPEPVFTQIITEISYEETRRTRRIQWHRLGGASATTHPFLQGQLPLRFEGIYEAPRYRPPPGSGNTQQPQFNPNVPDPNDEPVNEDDERACCICFERRMNTKLESCGHEFCMTCTRHMDAQAKARSPPQPFTCPTCRGEVKSWGLSAPKTEP